MTRSPSRYGSLAVGVLLVLAGSTACKTYHTTAPSEIAPQHQIQVRFASPAALHLACDSAALADSAARAASGCMSDTVIVAGVVELWGRFQREDGDSILVRVADLRNSSQEIMWYHGTRSVWLYAQSAVIGERQISGVRTIVLVAVLAASVFAISAIAFASSGSLY